MKYFCDVCPPAMGRGWQVLEEREWDTNGGGAEDDKSEPRRQPVAVAPLAMKDFVKKKIAVYGSPANATQSKQRKEE